MSLGFNQKDILNTNTPIVPANFTNAICYGQTGSGKTTGFMLPNIKERIYKNHSLLIYDFKGNLHLQVKMLANQMNRLDDVIEIGKQWGKKTNILKGISPQLLRKIHNIYFGGSSGGANNHDYWENASGTLLENVFELYLSVNKLVQFKLSKEFLTSTNEKAYGDDISIKSLFRVIKSPKAITAFIEDSILLIKGIDILYPNDSKLDKTIILTIQKAVDCIEALAEYRNMKSEDEVSGKYGVLSCLNSIFSNIATNDFLNHEDIDLVQALNKKKIIIVNTSSMSEELLILFNIAIYNRLQERIITNSHPNPISIFIDEAQKVLSYHSIPDVDVCRENKFEYVFATQDKILLENKIGARKFSELERNLAHLYSFKTNDIENQYSTNNLSQFEYIDINTNKSYLSKPIFMDQKSLDTLEHGFQKKCNAFEGLVNQNLTNSILLYNARLARENRVLVKNLENDEIREEDYVGLENNLSLDNILLPLHNNKSKKEDDSQKMKNENRLLTKKVEYLFQKNLELEKRLDNMYSDIKATVQKINKLKYKG